jgi:hypothetical protein
LTISRGTSPRASLPNGWPRPGKCGRLSTSSDYRGSATGGTAPDGPHWAGECESEILVLTSVSAMACAKLRLGPKGHMVVPGPSQSKLVDGTPPWKNLLEQPK